MTKGEELLGAAPSAGCGPASATMTRSHVARRIAAGAIVLALAPVMAEAQRGGSPPAPQPPRLAAPIDLTGYWVSPRHRGLALSHRDAAEGRLHLGSVESGRAQDRCVVGSRARREPLASSAEAMASAA